jgi:tetratricopeptide (TPR) repeat protein
VQKIEPVLARVDVDSATKDDKVYQVVAIRVFGTAGSLYQLKGEFIRAKELFERELALRRAIGETPAPVLVRLGYLNLRFDNDMAAQTFLTQALEIAGPGHLAGVHYGLALVAERKGEVEEARRLCQLASEQYARLGREGGVQKCQKLLARLSGQAARPLDQDEWEE